MIMMMNARDLIANHYGGFNFADQLIEDSFFIESFKRFQPLLIQKEIDQVWWTPVYIVQSAFNNKLVNKNWIATPRLANGEAGWHLGL